MYTIIHIHIHVPKPSTGAAQGRALPPAPRASITGRALVEEAAGRQSGVNHTLISNLSSVVSGY